jgi:hypothetical protein
MLPVTSLLATGHPALCALQVQLGHAEDTWVRDLAAIRQRGKRFQAEIDSSFLARERQGLDGHVGAGYGHVPAVRFTIYRDSLGGTF